MTTTGFPEAIPPHRPWSPNTPTTPLPLDLHDRPRPRVPGVIWLAALGLGVCMTLLVGVTTAQPAQIELGSAPADRSEAGSDGAAPGARWASTPLRLVDDAGTAPLEVTGLTTTVVVDVPACPPSAWRASPPATPLTITQGGTLPMSVALAPDAPSGCQGATATLRAVALVRDAGGGVAQRVAIGAATAGILGRPALAVGDTAAGIQVEVNPPVSGPQPSSYLVEVVQADGSRQILCRSAVAQPCLDTSTTPDQRVSAQYVAIARLGLHWTNASAPTAAAA